MRKIKAVVLEKSGSRYTVLGRDGSFRQVYRRVNAEVGEEVQIQPWTEFFGVRIWAGAVALFLVVLTSLLGWNLYQAPTAVALLSVDINPSLQFVLDKQGHLLEFETQNEDAKRMLSQIDLKGKPIEEVLKQIITQAYDQKFLSTDQRWIVVGYSPMNNQTIEQMPKELNEKKIILWVTEIGEKKGLTPQVAVFTLTAQERELAQKGDLTLGEYALWQTADKAGVETQPEKLKDTSERVRILENPQVQVLIKAEKNERQPVLPQASGVLKQDPGSIGKSGENGLGIHQHDEKLISPNKNLYPWIDTSRSENEGKQKDQQKEKDTKKDDSNADSNNKDQNQSKQTKDLNKPKTSENDETQRTKYGNAYVPSIPITGNFRRDTARIYKFPEYGRDK